MSVASLGLRRGTTAPVTAEVRVVDDRHVMWVELGAESSSGSRSAPLSSTISAVVEQAVDTARIEGMPLVTVLASPGPTSSRVSPHWRAGADWPRHWSTARASCRPCSSSTVRRCLVPPCCSASPTSSVMTEASYAFVNGPVMVEEFTGVRVIDRRAGRRRRAGSPHRACPASWSPTGTLRRRRCDDLLAYLPVQRRRRPAPLAEPTIQPSGPALRPAQLIPSTSTGSYDVRQVAAAIVDADSAARDPRAVGDQTS